MFAGCGVVSGQNQYLIRDTVGTLPGLEVNRPIRMENGVTQGTVSVYQDQPYSNAGQPAVVNNVSSPLTVPPPALKLGQEGFKKVCRTEEDSPCPFPGLASGVLEMRVKEGSKIRNLMGFAMARMQGETGVSGGGLRQVVFTGSGRAVTKTITCAEIMKRKVGSLHQLTKLQYKVVKEVWESSEGGTSEMTVHRTVPSISILLSKDPLDPQEPGYQPPETLSALWEEREGVESSTQTACKRPLGPLPYSNFPHCKRVCLGEGVSVHPPHWLAEPVSNSGEDWIRGVHLALPSTQAQCWDNQNTHSDRTVLSQKNWVPIPASRGQFDWDLKSLPLYIQHLRGVFLGMCNMVSHIHICDDVCSHAIKSSTDSHPISHRQRKSHE